MERADTRQTTLIIVIAMGILLTAGLLFMVNNSNSKSAKQDDEMHQLVQSSSDVVKASLNLYYAENQEYPSSMERLYDGGSKYDSTKPSVSRLSNFDYKVSGDGKTYQFTYQENGDTKTVKGNYDKDLH